MPLSPQLLSPMRLLPRLLFPTMFFLGELSPRVLFPRNFVPECFLMGGFLPCRFLFSPRTLSLWVLSPRKLFQEAFFQAGLFQRVPCGILSHTILYLRVQHTIMLPTRSFFPLGKFFFSMLTYFYGRFLPRFHPYVISIFWSVVEELESREEFVKEMRQLGASQRVIRSKLIVCIFKILTLFRMALKICSQGRLGGGQKSIM
jgi:hypothetical protein